MAENTWTTRKPPNEEWVEVRDGPQGELIEVMAVYGREGSKPHWKDRQGRLFPPDAFRCWRPLTGSLPCTN